MPSRRHDVWQAVCEQQNGLVAIFEPERSVAQLVHPGLEAVPQVGRSPRHHPLRHALKVGLVVGRREF